MVRLVLPVILVLLVSSWTAPALAGIVDDVANTGSARKDATPAGSAAPVAITTRAEPPAVTIGTRFRYTIHVEAAPQIEIGLPVLGDRLGNFVVADFGQTQPTGGPGQKTVVEAWYDLVGYETGAQTIPPLPIKFRVPGSEPQQIEAPSTQVQIASLLGDGSGTADVRDIKDAVPVRAPGYAKWVVAATAAAALVIAAVVWLIRRRRHPAVAQRPAHELALEALQRLRAEGLLERQRYEEYYVRLSAIVRHYVEGRFGLRAPEMTTDEFLAAAQRSRELVGGHRLALQEFLSEADLVKFARHVPSRDRAERAGRAAAEFIDATRPAEEQQIAAA